MPLAGKGGNGISIGYHVTRLGDLDASCWQRRKWEFIDWPINLGGVLEPQDLQ